jgi:hypothetical protein
MLKARENADFAVSTMERLLRNAQDITLCTSTHLVYIDEFKNSTDFTCTGGYIASGSARLTSTNVNVNCSSAGAVFICAAPAPGVPKTVEISVTASDASTSGTEGASVTSKTRVLLRNYTGF